MLSTEGGAADLLIFDGHKQKSNNKNCSKISWSSRMMIYSCFTVYQDNGYIAKNHMYACSKLISRKWW